MSAGTKIFLAGAVIFVAVLVGYYGVFTPQPVERPVDPITAESADTPAPAPVKTAERTDDGVRHLVPARRDTRMTPSTGNVPDASSRAARDETPNDTPDEAAAARSKAPGTPRSSARTSTETETQRTPRTDATARAQPSGTPRSTLNAPPRGASGSPSGDPAASRSSAPAATAPPKQTPAAPAKSRAGGPSSTSSSRTVTPATGSGRRPSAPPATVPYTIRSGDTLSSIAERRLGSARHWTRIARANPLLDPNRLRVGEVIRIPAAAAPSSAARGRPVSPPKPRTSGTVTYHVVRSGETLSDIADEHYGDSALWQMLYDANRPAIGTDPDRLEVGTRIVIPRKPR